MNIDLPEFDNRTLPDLNDGRGSHWGWIGAVNRDSCDSREVFLKRVKEGDLEAVRSFQDLGGNLLFAVACVSVREVTVVLFEKTQGPTDPVLIGTWTFKNEGVHVVSADSHQLEKCFHSTRLSWKKSFFAILRSLKE